MYTIKTVILIVVLVQLGRSQQEEWKRHTKRVLEFKCKDPQPRIVDLAELLKDSDNRHVTLIGRIFPTTTVLYRCESAGYCHANKHCKPKQIEEVSLVFSERIGYETKYHKLKAKNHTACYCESCSSQPK